MFPSEIITVIIITLAKAKQLRVSLLTEVIGLDTAEHGSRALFNTKLRYQIAEAQVIRQNLPNYRGSSGGSSYGDIDDDGPSTGVKNEAPINLNSVIEPIDSSKLDESSDSKNIPIDMESRD